MAGRNTQQIASAVSVCNLLMVVSTPWLPNLCEMLRTFCVIKFTFTSTIFILQASVTIFATTNASRRLWLRRAITSVNSDNTDLLHMFGVHYHVAR
jgi:hypothetical protein